MNLLDTGVVLEMLRRRQFKPGYISTVVLIETLRGVEKGKRQIVKEKLEKSFNIINIDEEVIEAYCEIYRELKQRGELLPDADLLIAATATAHNLVLKTTDEHFKRLMNLGLTLQ